MSSPFPNPVALSSIERLHFFDSSNRFPNRISCRLLVDQAIDLAVAKKACYWLAERHPILGCAIERIGGRLSWIHDPALYQIDSESIETSPNKEKFAHYNQTPASESQHWFHVQTLDSQPETLPKFLELLGATESYRPCLLIRQWSSLESADREPVFHSEIWWSIHHSFFDGAGGIQIISDWVQIYENLIAGRNPIEGLPEVDHQRFKFRNNLGLSSWKFLRLLPFQAIGLFGATKFVFRKSIQVEHRMPKSLDPTQGNAGPAVVGTWLPADDLNSIEQMCLSEKYNSNAKFLGDLFKTLQRWHSRRNETAKPNEWIRIILPINLRDIGDRRLSAANRSSLIQIDRRNLQEMTPFDLYRSIHREIGIVLRFQLDRIFLVMIRMVGLNEGILKRVVQNQKPRGIAVFTNLGRPFRKIERQLGTKDAENRSGLLNLKELDFLGPLRIGTPLNFSLAQFQGRLRLTLHYDSSVVGRAEAERLLNEYFECLCVRPESNRQPKID